MEPCGFRIGFFLSESYGELQKKGKNMKKFVRSLALCLILLGFFGSASLQAEAAGKQTIYNSPYVTFSPDGLAWTTNAGDTNYSWYPSLEKVTTGIPSSLRALNIGEHYYKYKRIGEIPIGYWRVEHRTSSCIHSAYPYEDNYHGLSYGKQTCLRYYYSGWEAYCADCGDKIADILMYMSKDAAASIDYMALTNESGKSITYYYMCPYCSNLEQGVELSPHLCNAISNNRYKVIYDPNVRVLEESKVGYMDYSVHMYNNATSYEGEAVTPVTHLTRNSYIRIGYVFSGWNTKPDGSGTSYQDGQEIFNLTTENCDDLTDSSNTKGVVTLYAQWRPSKSTLVINPNGGTYGSKITSTKIHKSYGESYVIGTEELIAPVGYKVSFESNGGNEIASITGTKHFKEWKMEPPFLGNMYNQGTPQEKYLFSAPDGNVDTLTAIYEPDAVILPQVTRPGYSFGGWYYDSDFKEPAGGAGDSITPTKDTTLYAQWVDLILVSKDNYQVNDHKGAVDLSWSQSDGNNKAYIIYQSRDGVNWTRINDSTDISNSTSVMETFEFSESNGTYTVPYTGLYTLTAAGAKGGNYSKYFGGYGGLATMNVWLSKGEVLTYAVGGSNGYNGGGSGSKYGNGGGMTKVISDKKGTLLVAGGGGGASPSGNGGAGGSSASLRTDKESSGQSGQTGGGAGYIGGNQGEYIIHTHKNGESPNGCYKTISTAYEACSSSGNVSGSYSGVYSVSNPEWVTNWYDSLGGTRNGWKYKAHTHQNNDNIIQLNNNSIAVNGNTTANIKVVFDLSGGHPNFYVDTANSYIKLLKSDGKTAFLTESLNSTSSNVTIQREQYNGSSVMYVMEIKDVDISNIGTSFSMQTRLHVNGSGSQGTWMNILVDSISLSGGSKKMTVCGYTEGQVISSKPAYGGSNYVNTTYARSYSTQNGVQNGNGYLTIQSELIGYNENLYLNDVIAPDLASPDSVDESEVKKNAGADHKVTLSWPEPADNGTVYYHQAESYMVGSTNVLCKSNITSNTLTSGIQGYYVLVDKSPSTRVTAVNGSFQDKKQFTATITDEVQYLHITVVDVAGNLSETTHIKLGAKEDTDIAWKLFTRQITLEEGENVYPAEAAKSYYVRSDGTTPIQMQMSGYMDGSASRDYQINYTIFESETDSVKGQSIAKTYNTDIADTDIRTDAGSLNMSVNGQSFLKKYPYAYTVRTNRNVEISYTQKFTIDQEASGKTIDLVPIIGADQGKEIIYSDYSSDLNNGLRIIADGEAPIISGLEIMESMDLINRTEQTIHLNITATDNLSGVKDFYVIIYNTDNVIEKTYTPGADGTVRIDITSDEPIFSGDFVVTAYAVDNVGNERELQSGTTEFALSAKVERILAPHDPIFKRGESGVLTFTTWGYADRVEVEFPAELTALDPTLNKTYIYTDTPAYVHEESMQFMIPLYAPENSNFEITVRAYKGDKRLEEHPAISTIAVGGSVLSEIRTRLR